MVVALFQKASLIALEDVDSELITTEDGANRNTTFTDALLMPVDGMAGTPEEIDHAL